MNLKLRTVPVYFGLLAAIVGSALAAAAPVTAAQGHKVTLLINLANLQQGVSRHHLSPGPVQKRAFVNESRSAVLLNAENARQGIPAELLSPRTTNLDKLINRG
ncbi:hypothetical protein ACIRPT_40215 [Streptomyces sp. NPDC101227]|uniref:hypothetical protein n=1 Tax=Streptomyces sp. NPDC101227 TaxID=3366136 RepID=UPI0038153A4F